MDYRSRLRILTSLGIAVLIAGGAVIVVSLLADAADRFGWPLILETFLATAIVIFVIDLITPSSPE